MPILDSQVGQLTQDNAVHSKLKKWMNRFNDFSTKYISLKSYIVDIIANIGVWSMKKRILFK